MKKVMKTREGFAIIAAIVVLVVLVFSGATLLYGSRGEVDQVKRGVELTHARLAISAGLEAGFAGMKDFRAAGEEERTLEGETGKANYRVRLREVKAGEVGPALAWLDAERSLVEMNIEGSRGRDAALDGAPKVLRVTAVADPSREPYRIVLWMTEKTVAEKAQD